MNSHASTTEEICPQRSNIAAYIDGELSLREELELEAHAAVCRNCRDELNEQKKLSCALDFALEKEAEIDLPANFTRVVVANAESRVSGLRRPQERAKALLICAALFVLGLLFLGGEAEAMFGAFGKFVEQVIAVGGFVAHLVYDISIGVAIVLRSLSGQIVLNPMFLSLCLIGSSFALLFALSRFIIRSGASE